MNWDHNMGYFDLLFKRSEIEMLKKSIGYLEKENTLGAEKTLQKTLRYYPNSANALFLMGILTVRQNRTIALDYFAKALKLNHEFKQAWFCKCLIFNSRLEFKKALNCIEKVLEFDQLNTNAINLKQDLLFYLRESEKLKNYKQKLFKIQISDLTLLLGKVVGSEEGKLIGAVDQIFGPKLLLLPGEDTSIKKFKTDNLSRIIFYKKNIMAIDDIIVYKLKKGSRKSHKDSNKEPIRNEDYLNKVVLTTEGKLLGEIKKVKDNNLYLNAGCEIDIRKFHLNNEGQIILPSSGIMSMDDIIMYRLPELDPKLVYKNHDEQAYIDRYFIQAYPHNLWLKLCHA